MCSIYGLGIINADELSAGMTAKVLWTIIGMYIVGTALYESGDIENILISLLKGHHSYSKIVLRLFLPVTLMSGFMNNTPIVATFIPICKHIAQLKKISEKNYSYRSPMQQFWAETLLLLGQQHISSLMSKYLFSLI